MKRWIKEETDFIKNNYSKTTVNHISETLGRTASCVRAKAYDLGLTSNGAWSEQELQILRDNGANMTYKQLMSLLPGRTRDAIQLKCSRIGVLKERYEYDRDFFEVIDTESKSYWLGFFFADGCVCQSKDNTYHEACIKLCAIDQEHLRKFNKALGGNLPIEFKDHVCSLNGKVQHSCAIRCYSAKMCRDLISHGCVQNKSFVVEMPTIDKQLMRHFIRGYFDGNGCISQSSNKTKTVAINFCSASQIFVEGLREYLYKEGISSYIVAEKGDTYRLYIRGLKNTDNMWHYMFDDATICLDRKYIKKQELYEKNEISTRLLLRSVMTGKNKNEEEIGKAEKLIRVEGCQ